MAKTLATMRRREKEREEKFPLKEPIFRQQEKETDDEYALFLVFRDIIWHERSHIKVTAIATQTNEKLVKEPHSRVLHASSKWRWYERAEAYDLFIQEARSDRHEKVLLQLKTDIEYTVMRIVSKIKRIEHIANAEDLTDPEIVRDMAVLQVMVDKGQCGKFLLDSYKTIFGHKLLAAPMKQVPELEWKSM